MIDTGTNEDEELMAMSLLCDEVSSGRSHEDAIRSVIAQFPGCAAMIADYAVHSEALGIGGNDSSNAADYESDRIASRVEEALRAQARTSRRVPESLVGLAEQRLGSLERLATTLTVGKSLLLKLDRRLIKFESIPVRFLNSLASHLSTTKEALASYFNLPPVLARAADYKARSRPVAARQQAFSDAVAACVASGEIDAASAHHWTQSSKE